MSEQPDTPLPGHSAGLEYQRRRAARERRDPGSAAPHHEVAWRKGQEGEKILGLRLNAAAQRYGGVAVLHDLVAPGARANLDHVVIGPAGVTVVDAKAWSGKVRLGADIVWQNGRRRRQPVESMRTQLGVIATALQAAGHADVPVTGAVCFVNDNDGLIPMRLVEVGGVPVGCTDPCVRHAVRGGALSVEEVGTLVATLRQHFTVNGGAFDALARMAEPEPVYVDRTPVVSDRPARVRLPGASGAPAPRRATRRDRRRARQPTATAAHGHRGGRRPPTRARSGLGADLAKLAMVLVLLIGGLGTLREASGPPLSRAELNASFGSLRAQASKAAGQKLRGPRVARQPDSFVLTYRGRDRCRVRARLDRRLGRTAVAGATFTPRRCAR